MARAGWNVPIGRVGTDDAARRGSVVLNPSSVPAERGSEGRRHLRYQPATFLSATVAKSVNPVSCVYRAPTSRFWSSTSVSIWMRRGLTLSLSGTVKRSMPWRWDAVSFSRLRNGGTLKVCS